jgi:hypothetical protein
VKKIGKVDGPDADKPQCIKMEFFIFPDNPPFNYYRQFAIFQDGCLEELHYSNVGQRYMYYSCACIHCS